MKFKKLPVLILIIFLGVGFFVYKSFLEPTRVALVNMRDHQYARFLKADDSYLYKIDRIMPENGIIPELKGYDAIYMFGHAIRMTDDIKNTMVAAGKDGAKVLVVRANGKVYPMSNLTEQEQKDVLPYYLNGGIKNTRELLNYSRRVFDGKKIGTHPVLPAEIIPKHGFYHPQMDEVFENSDEFKAHQIKNGLMKENQANVAILTNYTYQFSTNAEYIKELIQALEEQGLNVFPLAFHRNKLQKLLEADADLIIWNAHGRFMMGEGQKAVNWFKEHNIPILAPLKVVEPFEQWDADPQGMTGGFMSQSVTMPELDGGIDPFTLSAQYPNEDGLFINRCIPDRLDTFVSRVKNWISLKRKDNKDKKVAIFYYKGPGKNAMVASGLEVAESLYATLVHLKNAGYDCGDLPENAEAFFERIQKEGPMFEPYAEGRIEQWIESGNPEIIDAEEYRQWLDKYLNPDLIQELIAVNGEAPGNYLSGMENQKPVLYIPRVQFGNIVLLPQLMSALGEDEYVMTHGVKKAPPHPYVASYLWTHETFKADALMHFGTHGNLEFTPWKQVALSDRDWPDRMILDKPHIYPYIVNNIGEGVIAKRRSYAVLTTHLTPPFTEAELVHELKQLNDKVHRYNEASDAAIKHTYAKSIFSILTEENMLEELGLADVKSAKDMGTEQIEKVHRYLHELSHTRITDGQYTLGTPYTQEEAQETARLITLEPIVYAINKLREQGIEWGPKKYYNQVNKQHHHHKDDAVHEDFLIRSVAKHALEEVARNQNVDQFFTKEQIQLVRRFKENLVPGHRMDGKLLQDLEEELGPAARYLVLIHDSLSQLDHYKRLLIESNHLELAAIEDALNGGYIDPSAGGDTLSNPETLPTGRNLYSINVEQTPTKETWELAKQQVDALIQAKKEKTGQFPEKIAFSLWGGEFIRTQGLDVAEILYTLGVEPVWGRHGRVLDVSLMEQKNLGRPRIDVVVQTSGQFRDIAASRIELINKAVKLASQVEEEGDNFVKRGSLVAEKVMKQKGLAPQDAREFSFARVFGGVNGNYGTSIMGMVEKGDSWESEDEIAKQYIQNMGAIYMKDHWGHYQAGIFEAALQNTDTIIHGRSSNTWGPLSLDHVYEFMGGLNLAIQKTTGNDPDAYFSDLRNKYDPRVQGAYEAIWSEARTTVLNPQFIEALTDEGGMSSAEGFAEIFRNAFGWNTMKASVIDNELWDQMNEVYIDDTYQLGLREYFKEVNPFALQEMTAVLLESNRKGFWDTDEETLENIAGIHVELIEEFDAGCSGFVCDNMELQDRIAELVDPAKAEAYRKALDDVRTGNLEEAVSGQVLVKQNEFSLESLKESLMDNMTAVIGVSILILILAVSVIMGVIKGRGNN
ncbi:MAG: hypothetical protein CR997_08240 [Acidobacteria bacterium]|nr:MAG: hypothetical protein CR997_08240 [Acidobacteriota bacterium]